MGNKEQVTNYKMGENLWYNFKELWKMDRLYVILHLLTIPVAVLLPLLLAYLPSLIVKSVTNKQDISRITFTIVGIVAIILCLEIIRDTLKNKTSPRAMAISFQYQRKACYKSMETDYENIAHPDAQTKFRKVSEATAWGNNTIHGGYMETITALAAASCGIILYTGILSKMSLWILLLILLGIAVNLAMGNYVNNWDHKNRDRWLKLDLKLSYLTKKSGDFKYGKDIRLYQMKNWFPGIFYKYLKERIHWTYRMQANYYYSGVLNALMILLRDGAAYAYLIHCVVEGKMDAAGFVLYFGITTGFSNWCYQLVEYIKRLHGLHLSICNYRDFMQMKDRTNRDKGEELPKAVECPFEIRFEQVSYCYQGEDQTTIEDMNLTITPGEKIAIVGPNGAGKTTFVKLLCGLFEPTEGTIYFNSKNRSLYNREEYYSLFSTVFQETNFLPLSIKDNIIYDKSDCVTTPKGEVNVIGRMYQCLELAGIADKIRSLPKKEESFLQKGLHEDAAQLSGGEEQKLLLARAIYKDAPVLVLDEPTAALDPIAEHEMYLKYNELSSGKTAIFISHRLASTRFCDRILYIENGKIAEMGSHTQLMSVNGKYKEMFDVQSKYYKDAEDKFDEMAG
jgi:ABC-type multidrug transport system fused ATPase/permease subunit